MRARGQATPAQLKTVATITTTCYLAYTRKIVSSTGTLSFSNTAGPENGQKAAAYRDCSNKLTVYESLTCPHVQMTQLLGCLLKAFVEFSVWGSLFKTK